MKTNQFSPGDILQKKGAYISINPGCLDDKECWSYRKLQKLCKQLGLKASGKRVELVERLNVWHRDNDAEIIDIGDDSDEGEVLYQVPTAGKCNLFQ